MGIVKLNNCILTENWKPLCQTSKTRDSLVPHPHFSANAWYRYTKEKCNSICFSMTSCWKQNKLMEGSSIALSFKRFLLHKTLSKSLYNAIREMMCQDESRCMSWWKSYWTMTDVYTYNAYHIHADVPIFYALYY